MNNEAEQDQAKKPQAGSLRDRLRFAGLDSAECELLRDNRQKLLPHVEAGLRDLFLRFQTQPDAARNFTSELQTERYHDLLSSHWAVLTDARFDSLYAERVKALADAASRMNLDPRWQLAGHSVLLEHLVGDTLANLTVGGGVFSRGHKIPDEVISLVKSVIRTVLVDAEIAISLRFNELRMSHQKALKEAKQALEGDVLEMFGDVIRGIAERDLSVRIPENTPEAFAELGALFNQALDRLCEDLGTFDVNSTDAAERLGDVAQSAGKISDLASRCSTRISGNLTSLEELAAAMRNNANASKGAETSVGKTRDAVISSGEVAGDAISAMSEIENSAEKIGQIISVIDEIAFQTNLLALNAGIEAARAGDSGRGFAVVAQEVRALAQRSADAANEIKDLVSETKGHVENGVEIVGRTQQAIAGVAKQVGEISDLVTGVASSASEHTDALNAHVEDYRELGMLSANNAENAQRTSEASGDLHTVILELGSTIREFSIQRRDAGRVHHEPRRQRREEIVPERDIIENQMPGGALIAPDRISGFGN